eukprot:6204351-Pleurochrysis_carterae.AAC.2
MGQPIRRCPGLVPEGAATSHECSVDDWPLCPLKFGLVFSRGRKTLKPACLLKLQNEYLF